MTVGSHLRKLRLKRKVGLRALSRAVGRSPSYWSRVERDLQSPAVDELSKVAHFFGVLPQEFLIEKELVPRDQKSLAEVGIAEIVDHLESHYPVIVSEIKLVRTIEGDQLAHVYIHYEEKDE